MTLGKRILVAEDHEAELFVLESVLRRQNNGFEIVVARNGLEALDQVKRGTAFDLVITDLKMPGMGGIELTERIRAESPHTVFVWVTAYGGHTVREDMTRLGVRYCLDKPFEVHELRQCVADALFADISSQGLAGGGPAHEGR